MPTPRCSPQVGIAASTLAIAAQLLAELQQPERRITQATPLAQTPRSRFGRPASGALMATCRSRDPLRTLEYGAQSS
jgi:hypothetical protein